MRDGIYKIMQSEGDRPKLSDHVNNRQSAIIRQKIEEELQEFQSAVTQEEQIKEAGDFLAISDLLIRKVDVDQKDSKLLGEFQHLLHSRGISLNMAEVARRLRASEVGEYEDFRVVTEVAPENETRINTYYAQNDQWTEGRTYYL